MDLVLKTFQKENILDFVRTFSIPVGILDSYCNDGYSIATLDVRYFIYL